MSFTAQELANAANALIDYNLKGPAKSQALQDRPFLDAVLSGKKSFPGGKEFITWPVKGQYSTSLQGFTHDDTVTYGNPANIKRAQAKWYEVHAGITMTLTELKMNGLSVVDSMTGSKTSNHSERDMVVLTDLLQDKIDDMMEGYYRSFNDMLWKDGSQDAKQIPGITSFILDVPSAAGSTFGIDRASVNERGQYWWRNRASLGIDSSTASNLNLVTKLQQEFRQLRRYGGRPNKFFAGSDFMDAFEKELRSKGNFTMEGWANSKKLDASVADIAFKGIMVEYDPTLDDLGKSKYGYVLDMSKIKFRDMDGEFEKVHTPARPPEKYVLYRSLTTTGGLTCEQMNAHGVYSIS